MWDKLKADYLRYSGKKPNFLRIFIKFLVSDGFRAGTLYRAGYWCRRHKMRVIATIFERLMHHCCHCWISTAAEIGEGFYVAHVCSLVIGGGVIIGKNCDVRQNVTLGGNYSKRALDGRMLPVLGDNVSIGAGAVIAGPITIGSNSIVGANAVVIRDMPENSIIAGNPARVIKERWPESSGRKL